MGQQQSKDELLHNHVINGDIEAIRLLPRDGAGLEWIDKDGKTPLVVACMSPDRFLVAKTLIELGANVNAYRPGRHAGTPLHHAAKRGLDRTVELLLSSGANPLIRNDECQAPLDVARAKGFTNVVRMIERHICIFSGWLRELYGPGLLEALAPKLLSRKIWAVITPYVLHKTRKPVKLELALYLSLQEASPRTVISLWKVEIEEPNFQQSDPALIILDKSSKSRYKFAFGNYGDEQQMELFLNACRGTPEVMPTNVPSGIQGRKDAPAETEYGGWGETPNGSCQNGRQSSSRPAHAEASCNGWVDEPAKEEYNGWGVAKSISVEESNYNGWGPSKRPTPPASNSSWNMDVPAKEEHNAWVVPDSKVNVNRIEKPNQNRRGLSSWFKRSEVSANGWIDASDKEKQSSWSVPVSTSTIRNENPEMSDNYFPKDEISLAFSTFPSAPPSPEDYLDQSPINYPFVDLSLVHESLPPNRQGSSTISDKKYESSHSLCIICWESPAQGACVPCGHMAGCVPCLNEIKSKKGECPVCRAKIDQVIRLFTV